MYVFKEEKDLEAFESFVLSNGGIYMQSAKWADVKTSWKSYFFSGFDDNGNMVLTCLVLERHIPGGGRVWYSPAGAVCDYSNEELIGAFSDYMMAQMKKAGATMLIFDPCVELRVNGEYREEGKKLHRTLIDKGYILNDDASKTFYKSPVQLITDLHNENGERYTPQSILKKFEKGVRYSIRIGAQRGLSVETFTIEDIEKDPSLMDDFMVVMRDTSDRNNFAERGGEYCTHLMKVFGREGMDLMLVFYDKDTDAKLQNERLARKAELEKALETAPEKKIRGIREEIESIDRQTEHYEERVKETADDSRRRICVAGGLTVHYGNMSSCLFGGARNLLRNNLRSSHFFNYERLCHSMELGNDYHDLGYVLLDKVPPTPEGYMGPCVPNSEFTGINDFKKSFAADYIEYVGEYALVANKLKYFSYNTLIKYAKEAQHTLYRLRKKTK